MSRSRLPRLPRFLAGTALAMTLALPAMAQEPLATVNGVPITQAQIEAARGEIAGAIPAQVPPEQRDGFVLDFLVDAELLAQDASAQGLDQTKAYGARLEQLRKRALMEEALAANLATAVTEEGLRAFYDEQVASAPAQQEVRARHILVETEEEAQAVVERLEAGEDFEALADELTIDPSGKGSGGDLGYFGRGRMVPAFETAAFDLEPGGVSAPVQSQFGYHVIKSEDRRDIAPPAFETVKGQIREVLNRQAQQAYIERLRAGAEIDRADPVPVGTAPAAPAETPAPQ